MGAGEIAGTTRPTADLGFARLDLDRAARTGDPEVVFGAGKTPEQIVASLARLHEAHPDRAILATRVDGAAREFSRRHLPKAQVDDVARTVVLGDPPAARGHVAVVCAGTSDLPVARKCATTVSVFGSQPDLIVDVGVAGIHRLLAQVERIAAADAIVAVAGMEAALPTVLDGLCGAPLIAIPTSIGYGWHLDGLTALLAMLSSCAAGVVTVNIDNGFGAGVAAARIARESRARTRERARGHGVVWTEETQPQRSCGTVDEERRRFGAAGFANHWHCARANRELVTIAWVDAGSGCSGDMLLAALVDAGADLGRIRAGLSRIPLDGVLLTESEVRRHGLRARRVTVQAPETEPARHLPEIVDQIGAAGLPAAVERFAVAVFRRLAAAEASVHGVEPAQVHFHEVGAQDAVVDVVGCALGLDLLGLLDGATVTVSPIAVGGGTVTAAHGRLPVPPPVVLELLTAARAPVAAHPAARELCTPTGAALLVTLADDYGPMPAAPAWASTDLVTVETTVDDLDPRLWPDVLTTLRKAGGVDAWCAPITAHKGRPGTLLTVLVPPDRVDGLCAAIFAHTSTLGVRLHPVERRALHRDSVTVQHDGGPVQVKRGYLNGAIVTVQPEYEDVKAAAEVTSRPLRQTLDEVRSAATDDRQVAI